jgi:periplasmic protein TonB
VKALLRSDRPTAAMAVSVLTHAAVIGVLLWRIGPPTPSAAKVVPDIAMAMPALEQVAEERPVETVTAAAPPEIRPQETQIVEAEAAKVDEVPSVEPLPELIETKAPDPVVAVPPPKLRPTRTVAAPPPAPKPVETQPEPHPAPPVQETSGAPAAVQTADAARAVSAGPPPDYLGHLRAWIERYKQYPRMAQLRRQEGTALLRFTMARDGRVLSHRVERSSGHAVLDREVEELIERASPLPAMPADMTQDRLEVVVPIAFGLR